MLAMGDMRLMLDALSTGRKFDAALSASDRPFGRGVNLEIDVPDISLALAALRAAGWPLHLPLEERWYRAGDTELGVRQFVVADPDGHLMRLSESIGRRPAGQARDNAL